MIIGKELSVDENLISETSYYYNSVAHLSLFTCFQGRFCNIWTRVFVYVTCGKIFPINERKQSCQLQDLLNSAAT